MSQGRALVVGKVATEQRHFEHVGHRAFAVQRDVPHRNRGQTQLLGDLQAVPAVEHGVPSDIKRCLNSVLTDVFQESCVFSLTHCGNKKRSGVRRERAHRAKRSLHGAL